MYIGIIVNSFSPGSVKANVTVLFKEPTPAPLQEIEQAVSNGTFGDFNVSKISLLSSDEDSGTFVSKDDVKMVKSLILTVIAILAVMILSSMCVLIAALIKICLSPETPAKRPEQRDLYSYYNSITIPSEPNNGSEIMRYYYE